MIYFPNTTDKLQLVTGSATSGIDVNCNYVDAAAATLAPNAAGRQNTTITTGATTDILAAPGASTTRTLKQMTVHNKDTAVSCDVTVLYNANGTTFTLHMATLTPKDCLIYIEGIGFFTIKASANSRVLASGNSGGDVTANAADTYLTGGSINIGGLLQAGTIIRQWGYMTKTAAGTATPVFTLRCGTAGSTADTSMGAFTGVAQTAATDTGQFEVETIIQNAGASGSGKSTLWFSHKNTTTGLANAAQVQILQATFSAQDLTVAGKIWGISCNPGASGVWTFQLVGLEVINPKPA